MQYRKKILWLVSWYPNKYDRFDGDFIQRHAKAAALYHDVHVIFVKASVEQKETEEELHETEGLTEQSFYIPKQNGFLGKLNNYYSWKHFYKTAVDVYIQKINPSFIHVHIPWKVGLVALWAKKKHGIPFLLTEHWGIYNRIVDDNIHTKSFPVRHLIKRIYQEANAFISVSKYLGEGVNETLVKKEYTVIPNVVDTSLFSCLSKKHSRFTFLHVSNMVPLKNVEGILHAFHKLIQAGVDAQLILIGNKDNHYKHVAKELGLLNTNVFFRGEIPYEDVAKEMQCSHVFILNSNIENLPCVIGEALCCGLPVIATNVGGIPELITEQNGTLIEPGNSEALLGAMKKMYDSYGYYNKEQISKVAAAKFSLPSIAAQLKALYNSVGK